jgi:hypothetical protein
LVGLGFLAIRSRRADGGKSIFVKEFNASNRHPPLGIRLLELLQYDNYMA